MRLRRESQLHVDEALRVAATVADALQYAHDMRVLHRDVKPSNIFLGMDGRILLADFGIATAVADEVNKNADRTQTGQIIGTPLYMSPEQLTGSRIDARSDQYSLGCVVHEMLVGSSPFGGGTGSFFRRLNEDVASLRTVRPKIPEYVDRAVLQALERLPADRHRSMAEFRAALGRPRDTAALSIWGALPPGVDAKSCFMVMPFGLENNLQETYRDHIVPTIQGMGLTITRADDMFGHREVIREIWTAIGRARLVIADVTGRNPNVFYELGMAHTIGKDVLILAQREEDVPFDVRHLRYIKYEYTPRGVAKLTEALAKAVQAAIDGD